ncbi:peptidoglycan-binding domain-containing protein [Streptomyces sp. NBC_00273]|uniref:peptidoglycan-binding domain-containing protein n=1 Tax=Streptomyces sp. NBC_00273 TaxID=2903644 RepID=UPI002E2B63A6|nr:peptidoglycan-binding domain-containing protein [Streptomyces sp. NBC_00273]
MSTPFCPRCGDLLRCACGIAHHDASAGRTAAPAQFDRDWVRPYIAPHEPAPGGAPSTMDTATVSWVAAQAAYESGPPPGGDVGQPIVMSRPAGHRAHRPAKQRRPLRVTAALATLIGSAAIAGTYAFARSQDSGEATAQAPASRLDVLDGEDEPGTSPEASRSPGPLPSPPRRTPPTTGNSPARTPSAPAMGTSAGAYAAPAAGQQSGSPSTVPPSPAPPTAPVDKPTLRRHDTGPQVVDLQRRLGQLRLWALPQRGRFDRHLDNAVRYFQAKYGVRGDPQGVYGPATRRRLESLTS